MAKPTIVTRASKGSALTWTEGDTNLENLRDATIGITDGTTSGTLDLNDTLTFTAGTNVTLSYNSTSKALTINASGGSSGITDVVQDTTPQLGGDLDVNGYSIVSASNGSITVAPNGSGDIFLQPQYGKIYLKNDIWPTSAGTSGQVLSTDGAGNLSWATAGGGGITDVVQDTSPTLGGNLDTDGYSIRTTYDNLAVQLVPHGTGAVRAYGTLFEVGKADAAGTIRSFSSSYALTLSDQTNNIVLTPASGIALTPGSGRKTTATSLNYNEGAIYDLGTTGGTITPNVTNGNVQKITLNSALTMNGFTSPVAGQSLTLIIYGGTAYTSITSTMKFAGGIKTLTGTAGCIDILTVYYDGTTYFASLGKGFA